MGKNRILKTLGKRIGNVVLHKLLVKYTNRPESKGHLESEEIIYRDDAIKDSMKYNWNSDDKKLLKEIALEFIKNKKETKYNDVEFFLVEASEFVKKEIESLEL